ncbi:MAG: NAD-dependent epimerase/dehydratase family protein [Synergistaceae bacterium]|jgi:UDP-N-acetylglucosamine 4-epimerase|nr:NAD-dependent epimerase/dehydratase family protein [Synergistaceae bacterium]
MKILVTGGAGFIGSHLVHALLAASHEVTVLDDLSSGSLRNLNEAAWLADPVWKLKFIEGDICKCAACQRGCDGADVVFHEAAYVSAPGSLSNPRRAYSVNVEGFINMLLAAREYGVRRFIYASSSAVYGDGHELPKREDMAEFGLGRERIKLLSPYAASKAANEILAAAADCPELRCIGLRYFNVFGPKQNPKGAYAAVIPRWISAMSGGSQAVIYGDGSASRDFCYVDDVVAANLAAMETENEAAWGRVFNVASGTETTLNELFAVLARLMGREDAQAVHEPPREGDIARSVASVDAARDVLGWTAKVSLEEGLRRMVSVP